MKVKQVEQGGTNGSYYTKPFKTSAKQSKPGGENDKIYTVWFYS